MDSCILCLEVNENFVDSITINSFKWQENQIAKLIEKHFWPLVMIFFMLKSININFVTCIMSYRKWYTVIVGTGTGHCPIARPVNTLNNI